VFSLFIVYVLRVHLHLSRPWRVPIASFHRI